MSRSPNDSYLGLASIRGNTGELTGVSEEVEGATVRFRRGDVLFARLRPYLNKVHVAETDGTCSPEFYVLRVRANRAILPEYLAIILRSRWVLAQTVHMMTGNTHPRLADEDVAALRLPVPDVSVQSAMAN
jgi:restriction endonuclease S subunit